MSDEQWWDLVSEDGLDRLFADLPDLLTPEEVAELLRVKRATIFRWLNAGTLPGYKIGSNWRIDRESVRSFMTAGWNQTNEGE